MSLHNDNIVVMNIKYLRSISCEFRGIGIVNCIYFNPQNKQLWIIDSSIYDPDTDKKTKIEEC